MTNAWIAAGFFIEYASRVARQRIGRTMSQQTLVGIGVGDERKEKTCVVSMQVEFMLHNIPSNVFVHSDVWSDFCIRQI